MGFVGQPAGTGPIVVDVDEIAPSSGLEYVWAWIVSVEFTAGCDVPPQTRLKFTDLVTVWPGPIDAEIDRRLVAGQREVAVGRDRVGEDGRGGDQERDDGKRRGPPDHFLVHRSCLAISSEIGGINHGRIVPGPSRPVDGLIGPNGAVVRPPTVPVHDTPKPANRPASAAWVPRWGVWLTSWTGSRLWRRRVRRRPVPYCTAQDAGYPRATARLRQPISPRTVTSGMTRATANEQGVSKGGTRPEIRVRRGIGGLPRCRRLPSRRDRRDRPSLVWISAGLLGDRDARKLHGAVRRVAAIGPGLDRVSGRRKVGRHYRKDHEVAFPVAHRRRERHRLPAGDEEDLDGLIRAEVVATDLDGAARVDGIGRGDESGQPAVGPVTVAVTATSQTATAKAMPGLANEGPLGERPPRGTCWCQVDCYGVTTGHAGRAVLESVQWIRPWIVGVSGLAGGDVVRETWSMMSWVVTRLEKTG